MKLPLLAVSLSVALAAALLVANTDTVRPAYAGSPAYPEGSAQLSFTSPSSALYGCDDVDDPTVCFGVPSTTATLRLKLDNPPAPGYIGLQAQLAYDPGVYKPTALPADEVLWPDSATASRQPAFPTGLEGIVSVRARTASGAPFPVSNFAGNVFEFDINLCASEGTVVISLPVATAANGAGSFLETDDGVFETPAVQDTLLVPAVDPVNPVPVADTLTVHCYAHYSQTDTDGDRCPNVKELMGSPPQGGLRDPEYHWDFYDVWTRPLGDPTGWERERTVSLLGDIFGVAYRFGASRAGGPPSESEALAEALVAPAPNDTTGYHAEYDRSGPPGDYAWDLGPPDGTIDLLNDIFGVALQFGHDCTPFV